MGSEFRGEMLKGKTAQVLKQWHAEVRDRRKQQERALLQSSPPIMSNLNHAPTWEHPSEIIEEQDEQIISYGLMKSLISAHAVLFLDVIKFQTRNAKILLLQVVKTQEACRDGGPIDLLIWN